MTTIFKVGSTDNGTTLGSGMDYANVVSAWSALPATLADDYVFQLHGTAYNGGFTNEFIHASQINFSGKTMAGFTVTMTPEGSSGFQDNANKLTNALRYNTSNGVAIKVTAGDSYEEFIINVSGVILEGLQLQASNANGGGVRFDGGANSYVKNCIVEFFGSGRQGIRTESNAGANYCVNTVVIDRSSTGGYGVYGGYGNNSVITSCTIVRPSDLTSGGYGIYAGFATGFKVIDCAVFGQANGFDVQSGSWHASSGYICTDKAAGSGATAVPGSNNQTSKTYSSQFETVTDTSRDFRAKTGADLISNGTRDQTYTNDLDIVGQTRSTTTPTIGCWEVVASGGGAVPLLMQMYSGS